MSVERIPSFIYLSDDKGYKAFRNNEDKRKFLFDLDGNLYLAIRESFDYNSKVELIELGVVEEFAIRTEGFENQGEWDRVAYQAKIENRIELPDSVLQAILTKVDGYQLDKMIEKELEIA